jgi:plastocyanin
MPAVPQLSIGIVSGNSQIDSVRATLAQPLRVRVRQAGVPAQGVAVTWGLNDRNGSIAAGSPTTDADGIASATWSFGAWAGSRTATAFATVGTQALAVSFTATGLPGKPAFARAGPGPGPLTPVGSSAGIGVQVFDGHNYQNGGNGFGNPVSGMQVDFAVTTGAGSVDPSHALVEHSWPPGCGSWLCASVTYTLGPDEGINTATATVPSIPGHPPITFTTMAVSAVVQAGDVQNSPVDTAFIPAHVTVPVGRTVGWVLGDPSVGFPWVHNITFEDDPSEPTSSPTAGLGATHLRTFTGPPRVIRYRCTIHSTSFTEGMVGTVTVQ